MNTRKTIGIILMVLLLILCAVLMVLRFSAAKASDAAALRESMATPYRPQRRMLPRSRALRRNPRRRRSRPLRPSQRRTRTPLSAAPRRSVCPSRRISISTAGSISSQTPITPIAEYAPPELVTLEGQLVDSRIADALAAMAADTRAQGLSVYLSSGYRSYADQAANFLRVCRNNGVSDGKDSQGYYITMPAGHSEHQTGLCCDITDIYYPTKNRSIENTAMFQYMNAHCQEFGFILRFPDGMEPITA